ncbi:MAG: hypothetical protein ACYCPT_09130 [Acidimicrobiales bacterium]
MNYYLLATGIFIFIIIVMIAGYFIYSSMSKTSTNTGGGSGKNTGGSGKNTGGGTTCPTGSTKYGKNCYINCNTGQIDLGVECKTPGSSYAPSTYQLPAPTYSYSLAQYQTEPTGAAGNDTLSYKYSNSWPGCIPQASNNFTCDPDNVAETNRWIDGKPLNTKVWCTDPSAELIHNTQQISPPGAIYPPAYLCKYIKKPPKCKTDTTQNVNECVQNCKTGYTLNSSKTLCISPSTTIGKTVIPPT